MLEPIPPGRGLLFFSFLYRSDLYTEEDFLPKIEALFGKFLLFRPQFNPLSSYYSKEMGEAALLNRIFLVSSSTFPREFLLSSKLISLEWEKHWSHEKSRRVNVDVGFLTLENFLLATTKNFSHRVFLGQNIFADLTYQCLDGVYQTLPWTYPDFKDQEKLEFFNWCRSYLLMRSKV
jgi:hypothetical protein